MRHCPQPTQIDELFACSSQLPTHFSLSTTLLIQLSTFPHRMEFSALWRRTFGPSVVSPLALLTIRCLHLLSKPTGRLVFPWVLLKIINSERYFKSSEIFGKSSLNPLLQQHSNRKIESQSFPLQRLWWWVCHAGPTPSGFIHLLLFESFSLQASWNHPHLLFSKEKIPTAFLFTGQLNSYEKRNISKAATSLQNLLRWSKTCCSSPKW